MDIEITSTSEPWLWPFWRTTGYRIHITGGEWYDTAATIGSRDFVLVYSHGRVASQSIDGLTTLIIEAGEVLATIRYPAYGYPDCVFEVISGGMRFSSTPAMPTAPCFVNRARKRGSFFGKEHHGYYSFRSELGPRVNAVLAMTLYLGMW
jgi:hypothetical protein